MASEFQIGLLLATMAPLDSLSLPNPFPTEYESVGETYESLNGRPMGDGPGTASWKFDILSLSQFSTLLNMISGQGSQVYIRTRVDLGSTYAGEFKTFSAYMWRPTSSDFEWSLGRRYVQDVTFKFTALVEQVEE